MAVVATATAMMTSLGMAETVLLKYSSMFGTYRSDDGLGLALTGNRLAWTGSQRPAYAGGAPDNHAVFIFSPSLKTTDYGFTFDPNQSAKGYRLAFDGQTNIWVAGDSFATDSPVTPGAYQSTNSGSYDGHLMKLDPSKTGITGILYATYLGGSGFDDHLYGLAVDTAGCVYVAGLMQSTDMPTTPNAYQKTSGGKSDGVFAKFDSTGGVQFVSYFGGAGGDAFRKIALDADGNIYLVLTTSSAGLPVVNAYDSTFGGNSDMYLVKFDPTGTNILYSTYFGSAGNEGNNDIGLAVRDASNVYLCGQAAAGAPTKNAWKATCAGGYDLLFARFDTTLSGEDSLRSASFYGGSNNDFDNPGIDMTLDVVGNIYIVGSASSTNLPLKNAVQTTLGSVGTNDAVVVKFTPDCSKLLLATYLGGSGSDYGQAVAVDGANNIYLTGKTFSTNFPLTPDAARSTGEITYQWADSFITKLSVVSRGAVIIVR